MDTIKNELKLLTLAEEKNSQHNRRKILESWVKIMRSEKNKQLKKKLEILSQSYERDTDRADAMMQMYDLELDEAEEQQKVAISSGLDQMNKLVELFKAKLSEQNDLFMRQLQELRDEYDEEAQRLDDAQKKSVAELTIVTEKIVLEEAKKEQFELTEHQASHELIRNKNIEEDHQMRSNLEEQIEELKEKCNAQLASYKQSTEANTADYSQHLEKDIELSRLVESKMKQVDRLQNEINGKKLKNDQSRREWKIRNAQLRLEKEHVQNHLAELKRRMHSVRVEEHQRMLDLVEDSNACKKQLKERILTIEKILKLSELCRKLEGEKEKVLPFHLGQEMNVDDVQLESESPEEKVNETFQHPLDETNYLNNFYKKFNKIQLDVIVLEKEKQRLEAEHLQLRSVLKQFLHGVSVTPESLSASNPLLIVNGKIKYNAKMEEDRAQAALGHTKPLA